MSSDLSADLGRAAKLSILAAQGQERVRGIAAQDVGKSGLLGLEIGEIMWFTM